MYCRSMTKYIISNTKMPNIHRYTSQTVTDIICQAAQISMLSSQDRSRAESSKSEGYSAQKISGTKYLEREIDISDNENMEKQHNLGSPVFFFFCFFKVDWSKHQNTSN
jgi:hypothetical protein